MFSMWEKVSGAIMFVRVNGRVIPSPAQAESTNFKANSEWGTQEVRNRPEYPEAERLKLFEHQGRKDHEDRRLTPNFCRSLLASDLRTQRAISPASRLLQADRQGCKHNHLHAQPAFFRPSLPLRPSCPKILPASCPHENTLPCFFRGLALIHIDETPV